MLDILEEDLSAEWNYKMAVQKGMHDTICRKVPFLCEIIFHHLKQALVMIYKYLTRICLRHGLLRFCHVVTCNLKPLCPVTDHERKQEAAEGRGCHDAAAKNITGTSPARKHPTCGSGR